MYNSNLAHEIENAVQQALSTSNFSELNKNITEAVNTSITQIDTKQNRFYRQYANDETTAEHLEHVDGEVVNGDARADYNARRRAAQQEAEQARMNSRRAQEARRQAADARRREEAARRQNAQQNTAYQRHENSYNQYYRNRYSSSANARQGNARHVQDSAELVPISRNPAGRVSGILFTVFGSLGLAASALMFVMFSIFTSQNIMPYTVFGDLFCFLCVPTALVSGGMACIGTTRRHRVRRFYQYVRQFRGRAYCSIKELSSHIGKSDRFVLKDLRKMISLGMFPEGHIDDQKTCVMLNGSTYDQYRKTQNAYLLRQAAEKQPAIHAEAPADQPAATAPTDSTDNSASSRRASLPPKVIQVLSAGDSYLTQIREANAAIPGEVISAKLDKLEAVIRKIYARIEEHPEQVDELNKFISYYLPTTLKLVGAYRDFDAQSIQGENIRTAKQEIESTLDTIIYAFESLLDKLYAEDAMDISTDISVLQTMLAQEGLTKSAFEQE